MDISTYSEGKLGNPFGGESLVRISLGLILLRNKGDSLYSKVCTNVV